MDGTPGRLLRATLGLTLVLGACAPVASAASVPGPRGDARTIIVPADGLWPLDLGKVMIDDRDLPDEIYRFEEMDYGALGAATGDEDKASLLRSRGFLGGQERHFRGTGALMHAGMSAFVSAYLSPDGAALALAENIERITSDEPHLASVEVARGISGDVHAFAVRGAVTDLFDSSLIVYGRQGRFSFGLQIVYRDGEIPDELVNAALRALRSQADRLALLDR